MSKKIMFGTVAGLALVLVATPAYAGEAVPEPITLDVVATEEVVDALMEEPDWDTQPEWAYEWRDREVSSINCGFDADGNVTAERTVQQSMWRPSEPEWRDNEWIIHNDWEEWAWPEAVQTVYRPGDPGDCAAPEAPTDDATEDTQAVTTTETPELAETGGVDGLSATLFGAVLLIAGVGLMMKRKEA